MELPIGIDIASVRETGAVARLPVVRFGLSRQNGDRALAGRRGDERPLPTWAELAASDNFSAGIVELIAAFGKDPEHQFGLEMARQAGDRGLMRMAAKQILEDWEDGEAAACRFMNASV